MKFSAFSIWQLSPVKWLRKIRGFRLVYTPLLAIVLFTAVMGVILGTLQLQEKSQQEAALFRELSFAKQRIQLRFANNTDALVTINREIAAITDQAKLKQIAYEQADDLVINNHEIVRIIWLNPESQRQWMVPPTTTKTDWMNQPDIAPAINEGLKTTIELSRVTNRAAFSQYISLNLSNEEPLARERKNVFCF